MFPWNHSSSKIVCLENLDMYIYGMLTVQYSAVLYCLVKYCTWFCVFCVYRRSARQMARDKGEYQILFAGICIPHILIVYIYMYVYDVSVHGQYMQYVMWTVYWCMMWVYMDNTCNMSWVRYILIIYQNVLTCTCICTLYIFAAVLFFANYDDNVHVYAYNMHSACMLHVCVGYSYEVRVALVWYSHSLSLFRVALVC